MVDLRVAYRVFSSWNVTKKKYIHIWTYYRQMVWTMLMRCKYRICLKIKLSSTLRSRLKAFRVDEHTYSSFGPFRTFDDDLCMCLSIGLGLGVENGVRGWVPIYWIWCELVGLSVRGILMSVMWTREEVCFGGSVVRWGWVVQSCLSVRRRRIDRVNVPSWRELFEVTWKDWVYEF